MARLLEAAHRGTVPLIVPPGDDAAVLRDGTVLTTDLLVEGVHFAEDAAPRDVAWKAVAVNASDVSAMGATPTWMLLALATRADDPWSAAFADGLAEAASAFGVDLIGGDTTSTPGPRFVSVTLAGRLEGPPLRRDGGRPGDVLFVTGTPGLAGARYANHADDPDARRALDRPAPPCDFARAVAPLASAGMDLSDGLAADLPRLCAASGTGARMDPGTLPDHPALHEGPVPARTLALAAGDDYELLVAVPPAEVEALRALASTHGVRLSRIGVLTDGSAVELTDGPWPRPPWTHFEDAP